MSIQSPASQPPVGSPEPSPDRPRIVTRHSTTSWGMTPRPRAVRVTRATGVLLALSLGLALGAARLAPTHPALAAGPSLRPAASGEVPTPRPSPAEGSEIPTDFDLFWEALRIVRDNYVDTGALTDQNLTQGAIRGMVDALGDTGHTAYLTAEEVQAEIDALDGRVIGIGVSVDTRGGVPVIISVFPGSPAAGAGLRSGDVIESVDGRRVDRVGIADLIDRVRGEPGTTVTLGILRQDGSREDVPIVRAEVSIPPVAWSMVPGTSVAVVGITQFSDGASREARRAVRRAIAEGATGVVLDLRGNPGGLVHEAIGVARLFLPKGSVVYLEEGRDGQRRRVTTPDEAVAPDVPLVVLIDEGSASSAEIVAAALRDAGRARLVGQRTFGTGTVLGFFPLSDGSAIRLGTLRWLTPEGVSVFETGLPPDVPVRLPATGAILDPGSVGDMGPRAFRRSGDSQLRRAVRLLTRDPRGTPRPAVVSPPPAAPVADASAPSTAASEAPPSSVGARE